MYKQTNAIQDLWATTPNNWAIHISCRLRQRLVSVKANGMEKKDGRSPLSGAVSVIQGLWAIAPNNWAIRISCRLCQRSYPIPSAIVKILLFSASISQKVGHELPKRNYD